MAVSEGVVNAHVFKEPADVNVKEAFYFCKVELGIYEDGTDVGFDYVGEALGVYLDGRIQARVRLYAYLWGIFRSQPVITRAV